MPVNNGNNDKYLDKKGLSYLWTKIKNMFALKSHTHSISQVSGLQTELNGKVDFINNDDAQIASKKSLYVQGVVSAQLIAGTTDSTSTAVIVGSSSSNLKGAYVKPYGKSSYYEILDASNYRDYCSLNALLDNEDYTITSPLTIKCEQNWGQLRLRRYSGTEVSVSFGDGEQNVDPVGALGYQNIDSSKLAIYDHYGRQGYGSGKWLNIATEDYVNERTRGTRCVYYFNGQTENDNYQVYKICTFKGTGDGSNAGALHITGQIGGWGTQNYFDFYIKTRDGLKINGWTKINDSSGGTLQNKLLIYKDLGADTYSLYLSLKGWATCQIEATCYDPNWMCTWFSSSLGSYTSSTPNGTYYWNSCSTASSYADITEL